MNGKHLKWDQNNNLKDELIKIFNEKDYSTEISENWLSQVNSESISFQKKKQIVKLFKCLFVLNRFNLDNLNKDKLETNENKLKKMESQVNLDESEKLLIDQDFSIIYIPS